MYKPEGRESSSTLGCESVLIKSSVKVLKPSYISIVDGCKIVKVKVQFGDDSEDMVIGGVDG